MKVVALVDNITEDLDLLRDLISASCEGEDLKIIVVQEVSTEDNSDDDLADDVFFKINQELEDMKLDKNEIELRLSVDLILKRDDLENLSRHDEKSGLRLLRVFAEKYYSSFGKSYYYLMSKKTSGGEIFSYTTDCFNKIPGHMVFLKKPISVSGDSEVLSKVKIPTFDYTDILPDELNSRRIDISFVNALIYGQRGE